MRYHLRYHLRHHTRYRMHVQHKSSRRSFRKRTRKSRFYKKVSKVITARQPIKKTNLSLAQAAGQASPSTITLTHNTVQDLGPIFNRVVLNAGVYVGCGGDGPSVLNINAGDTALGNVIKPVAMLVRGVLMGTVYSPDVTVRMYLVRQGLGTNSISLSNMYMGLTQCKLIDQFNKDNLTLLAQKDFRLRTAVHTGNAYLPQSKPGGTSTNNATGTFWDTPGVGVLGNTDTTYITENVVYFNANTMSGSYAPHTLPFIWNIPLKNKIPRITYNEATTQVSAAQPSGYPAASVPLVNYIQKDFSYHLVTYTFVNDLVGSAPVAGSATIQELTIQTFWKDG
nr:MAG: capsid protein [Cressdnaviricota sp.]